LVTRLFHLIRDDRLLWLSRSATIGIVPFVAMTGAAWAVFVFQTFGERQFAVTTIAGILLLIVLGPRLGSRFRPSPVSPRGCGVGQSLRLGRRALIGGISCWLGLIAWSTFSAGGPMPPFKSDPAAIRVLTWNILHGSGGGAPWTRWGWPARKTALQAALTATQPEIFCVQEALAEQVDAIAAMLPEHNHVGVGRDDGRSAGEYCAIFYDSRRFAEIDRETFWLEEPTHEPPSSLTLGPKRICTWARLFDRASGRYIRVYNTHLYLTENASQRAVRVILAWIAQGDPADAILVTGDFNAPPGAASRRLFEGAGLISTAEASGSSTTLPTYHFYGIRLRSLDEVLGSRDWIIREHRVLDVKPGNTYPSDHFGVMADLVLAVRKPG
jgi:endonuclease/exonuclease/phosphatase family metal-dependent hydrolase